MNQNESPQSRANEVWRRFVGMFGGDSLQRKYGPTPPPEWIAMLGRLNDFQIERGIRRLAYSGKTTLPSLPEFTRLCRAVGTDEFDEGQSTVPRLAPPESPEDPWGNAANRYLLGHIAKRMQENPRFYGKPASYEAMRGSDSDLHLLGLDKRNLDASGEFVENVHKLVAAKNAWADDMRDLAVKGEVPPETQKAVWRDYMQTAETGLRA